MMWQSDNDFLNDVKNIDDFGSDFIDYEYYSPPAVPKSKITVPKRGLFVELEDEEKELEETMKNPSSINDCMSVEKQIEFATGKIYSNDYLASQWGPQHKRNKSKEEIKNGFIFKPSVDIKPLDPSNDRKVINSLPKFSENEKLSTKTKKQSVASAIEKSVLSTKNSDEKKTIEHINTKNSEPNTSVKLRFALPISKGQIYYDDHPNTEDEYRSDSKWSSYSNTSWDDSSSFTESSRSGNIDSSSNFGDVEFDDSNHSNNKKKQYKKKSNNTLNISSKIDFPPLG